MTDTTNNPDTPAFVEKTDAPTKTKKRAKTSSATLNEVQVGAVVEGLQHALAAVEKTDLTTLPDFVRPVVERRADEIRNAIKLVEGADHVRVITNL